MGNTATIRELAERFTKPGVANVSPADAKKLKPLAAHYLGQPHPFTACVRDQVKHGLSPDHAKRRCAVLLDYFDPARARHSRSATSLANMRDVEPTAEHRAQARRIMAILDLAGPSTAERKRAESKGQAMQGGRFPIRNESDLRKAIHAVGRARPNTEQERAKVRRYIIRRARALGLSNLIPDNWQADGSLK